MNHINKKGTVRDVMTGLILLFAGFILLGMAIYILQQWNSGLQSMDVVPAEAKAETQAIADTYPTYIGWIYMGVIIGLLVYTLITAYLVEVVSYVFFIVGVAFMMANAVVSGIMKYAYDAFAATSVYGSVLPYMPGAVWYFWNPILWNTIWGFMILIALYFKREA